MTRAAVGMSGGVDSSAAALLLLERGYDVTGITMRLTPDCGDEDCAGAKSVCDAIGIPHLMLDLRELFAEKVIEPFIGEYLAGRTPSPCTLCNREIKFGAMLDFARDRGFDLIATGHYARVEKENGRFLLKAAESKKDQSYFLWRLSQEQLSRVIFPLADFGSKEEIRQLVRQHSLPVAEKKDSVEICFVPDGNYADFISERRGIAPPPGAFVDANGNEIGRHCGITRYTIGQRKGLGAFGKPMFVTQINADENTVMLDSERARHMSLSAKNANWIAFEAPPESFRARVKIRSGASAAPALITTFEGGFTAQFDSPVLSVTSGQSAVIYSDTDTVLGGGDIV